MLVFLLSGLWHGAAMHFVVWGLLMGAMICIHTVYRQHRMINLKKASAFLTVPYHIFCVLLTFTSLTLVEVFFRANDCGVAVDILKWIFTFRDGSKGCEVVGLYVAFYGLCVFIVDLLCVLQNSEVPFGEKIPLPVRSFGYAVMIFLLLFIGENDVQPFIYFQF